MDVRTSDLAVAVRTAGRGRAPRPRCPLSFLAHSRPRVKLVWWGVSVSRAEAAAAASAPCTPAPSGRPAGTAAGTGGGADGEPPRRAGKRAPPRPPGRRWRGGGGVRPPWRPLGPTAGCQAGSTPACPASRPLAAVGRERPVAPPAPRRGTAAATVCGLRSGGGGQRRAPPQLAAPAPRGAGSCPANLRQRPARSALDETSAPSIEWPRRESRRRSADLPAAAPHGAALPAHAPAGAGAAREERRGR
jgi:hypothetical protein